MYQFIKNRQFFKITLERDLQEKCDLVHTRYQVSVFFSDENNTPVNKEKTGDFQFKTPTINSIIKRPKSTTKK